jgi:hypothetical protein
VAAESLVARARRDGLIDGRQEAELRLLRGSSDSELLRVMRSRGYLRESELPALAHRHIEQVALEALGEASSEYRLGAGRPPEEAVLAAGAPAVPLLVEALRRSAAVEAEVAALGGVGCVPQLACAVDELAPLGLHDRELRLLEHVDGALSVEELLLGSGLTQTAALKLLVALRILGHLTLSAPAGNPTSTDGALDLQRLDAMYQEIQEADYFAVLGLTRTAGTDEVQRAYQRLAAEFDPLKFIGHPDASLQHRARVIQDALAEAACALADDRLRAGYARHLLD